MRFDKAQLSTGLRIHYSESGDARGTPVVFVHGWPDSWFSFSRVLPLLPATLRLIALDQRGFGDSDHPDSGYTIPGFAADLVALLDALDIDRAILVGHSYGGATALAMAVRRPAAVAAYVIVDSATYEPSRQPDAGMRLVDLPLVGVGIAETVVHRVALARLREGLDQQFPSGRAPPAFAAFRVGLWSEPKVIRTTACETLKARAGLAAWIFIPESLEPAKVAMTAVYGPKLVRVRGTYDDVNRLCTQVADRFGWGLVNVNLRTYYGEGSKTYEARVTVGPHATHVPQFVTRRRRMRRLRIATTSARTPRSRSTESPT